MNVEILHDQPVSRNFLETPGGLTCAFPQVTAMANGDVACLYRQGITKHSHDGILLLQTSSDRGASWSEPGVVFDGRDSTPPETVVSGGLCEGAPDTLFVTFFTLRDLKPGVYMFTDEVGQLESPIYATIGTDSGTTWSSPTTISPDPFPRGGITSKPHTLPGGELFIPLEVSTEAGVASTAATFSSDGGRTFETPLTCADDPLGRLNLCDGRFALLKDGRLLMLLWTFQQADEKTVDVHRSFSDDQGRTWSEPQPTGFVGQVTVPLALPSGGAIALSNFRQLPDGIRLWASPDDGESWLTDQPVQMWDPRSEEMVGVPIASEPADDSDGGVWEALGGFTFGTPDVVNLGDGSQLMVYYATVDGITGVRACRFRVTL